MNDGIKGEEILPHREPFLFLDRLVSHSADSSVGIVTFGAERDFFRGHFPSCPIVPGVILLEAMCQSAAAGAIAEVLGSKSSELADEVLMFAGADKVRFRRPVRPGDTLETRAQVLRSGRNVGKFHVCGYVNDELAVEADIFCVSRKVNAI